MSAQVVPLETAVADASGFNIASHLPARARELPTRLALVEPAGRDAAGRRRHVHLTFAQLDARVDRIAHGLQALGLARGDRVVVLARPGIDLIAIIYALFKLGAPPVFIDPGMGLSGFLASVEQVRPAGLITLPWVHTALGLRGRRALRSVRHRVRVGPGLLGLGLPRLEDLAASAPASPFPLAPTAVDETAAVLFTSGSTGPAKGVVYEHGMFEAQVRLLRDVYGLGPSDVDAPGLPVFALFSVALGATVVFPDMDYSAPAALDPQAFVDAIEDFGVTYSFGSPAIWGPVARHCVRAGQRLPSLRRVFMAGAPVPPRIHEDLGQVLDPGAQTYTPYGATEALPIANASGASLRETFAATRAGRGTCVGRPVPGVELRVIGVRDEPIPAWSESLALPAGQVGEIVVRGPMVTRRYFEREEATAAAKIPHGAEVWHRMGDLGYLDEQGRLWFVGRTAHRVETAAGPLYTVPTEAVFDQHPRVRRTALVGLGPRGAQRPVLVVEPEPDQAPTDAAARGALEDELRALGQAHPHTRGIQDFLLHGGFPVDVRHNAKIRREELAAWAEGRVGRG